MPVFNPDSKFMTITNTILDYVKLGLLFLLFSIPVITIGAAATAGMAVAMKIERGEAPAIWEPFKNAFKENFKQTTLCTFVLVILYGILAVDWYQIMQMENSTITKVASTLIIIVTLLLTMISMYLFANIARYELSSKAALHNAVIYTILNFPKNLVAVAIIVLGFVLYDYIKAIVPIVICAVPALEFYYFSKICVQIYRKVEDKGGQ